MAENQTSRQPAPPRRGLAAIADQAWLLMLLPGLFWASNAIVSRAIIDFIPPVGISFWRWLLASFLILPLAWPYLRYDLSTLVRSWRLMLLLGFLGIAAFNAVSYYAAHTTTAVNMVMLQSAGPVMVVVGTFMLFGERVTGRQAAGIALSMVGALTLVAQGDVNVLLHLRIREGDFLILLVTLGYATYTALLRRAPRVHPFSLLYATVLIGSLMVIPAYLLETWYVKPMPFTWLSAGIVLGSALFPSMLSYLAYNRAVALLGPNVAGLATHMVPVYGVILAAIFLHELPQPYHFVGIAFIGAGIYLATRRRPQRPLAAAGAPAAAPERPAV